MAEDIHSLEQSIERTTDDVKVLRAEIERLTQALNDYITAAQKTGGIATLTGISAGTQRAIEDPESAGRGLRTGGGSRIIKKEDTKEIERQADAIRLQRQREDELIATRTKEIAQLDELRAKTKEPLQQEFSFSTLEKAKIEEFLRIVDEYQQKAQTQQNPEPAQSSP